MDESSGHLSIILGLIIFHALITLAYAALKNSRLSVLQEQAEEGNQRARQALALLNAESRLAISYSLSMTLLHYSIAALTTILVILPALSGDTAMPPVLAFVIVILVGALLLIPGDIVPESIGSTYNQSFALLLLPLLRLVVLLLSPITLILLNISYLFSRLFGSSNRINTVTEEEIMTLVNAGHTGGTIEDEEKAMIYSVLQLDSTNARELMTPRIDVVAFDINTPVRESLDLFIDSGFSRIPVYEDNIDNIVGVLYAKDLLPLCNGTTDGTQRPVRDLLRPAYFVPEDRQADKLLREMQNRKTHMAIVEDGYGGTSGIVTIENLIEEIVGDIQDEYDDHEEAEYVQNGDDDYLIDASMDLDDVNDLLNTTFDTNMTDTLGGFIYMQLGRVPEVGEIIETDEVTLLVRSIDGRRIRKVHVTRKHPQLEPDPDDTVLKADDSEDGMRPDASASATDPDDDDDNDGDLSQLADAS